jgi:hypothetical protein
MSRRDSIFLPHRHKYNFLFALRRSTPTRVVKYRTAIIIAIMVMVGAVALGHNNINKLASISTNNEVTASVEDVEAALANGTLATLRLKSALKAFIISRALPLMYS